MDMLKLRNDMKRRKPDFARQQFGLKKQFRGQWRRPRGLHSKLRLAKKGHGSCPAVGYSSPKSVKGLMRDGKRLVIVNNIEDLKNFKNECVVIGSNVGLRKRIVLLDEIVKKNLIYFGVKDLNKYLENVKKKALGMKEEGKKKKEKRSKVKEDIKKGKKEEKDDKKEEKEESRKGKVEEKRDVVVGKKDRFALGRKVTAPKSQ